MCIPRNPDGSLTRLHPYAPTYVVVLRNGRRVYHDVEPRIRAFMSIHIREVVGFYLVNRGRSVALPIK